MAYTLVPAAGTITVSGANVTGSGTTFTAYKMGTLIFVKDIGVIGQVGADPTSDTALVLVMAWAGTAVSGATFGVYLQNDPATYSTLIRQILQNLASTVLSAFGSLTGAADTIPYFTGPAAMATTAFTTTARSLLASTSVRAMQAVLGFQPRSAQLDGLGAKFQVAGNALTATLTQSDGTSAPSATAPIVVGQRSASAASAASNQRTVTTAPALTLPSGATLGAANATASRKYWYLQDNAGAEELVASGTDYGESFIGTSVTISGAATSASVLYATAGQVGVAMRKVLETVDTQVTAGTYLSTPSVAQVAPFSSGSVSEYFKTLYSAASAAVLRGLLGSTATGDAVFVAASAAAARAAIGAGSLTGIEVIKTADYNMVAADIGKTVIFNKATAINGTFDAAATLGSQWMVLVKNIGAGTLTLDPNGAETIDGLASVTLTTGQSAFVSSNGTALRTFEGAGGTSYIEAIKTADYNMVAGDSGKIIVFNKATAINGTFDAAAALGSSWGVIVKNIGTGVLALDPNGSELIDGGASLLLAQGQSVLVTSNGSQLRTELLSAARLNLAAGANYYVGAALPTPTISIASPAVVGSTAHALLAGDPVVFSVPPSRKTVTISVASPAVVTMNSHGYAAGRPVKFNSSGMLPAGITPGTTYYVIAAGLTTNTFEISATPGGAAINTSAPAVTISNASPAVVTLAAHGQAVSQAVQFATTGTLPTGLTAGTVYYIISAGFGSGAFQVAATNGGAAINTTGAGSGTHTLVQNGTHYCSAVGALPTGITEGTTYYVSATGLTANSFQVSATLGGASVNTSGSVTGSPIYGGRTGNDANDGSAADRAHAWLTLQAAINYVYGKIDLYGFNVTINCADGSYLNGITQSAPQVGSGVILVTGNATFPSNFNIIPPSGNAVTLNNSATQLSMSNFRAAAAAGNSLEVDNGAVLNLSGTVELGGIAGHKINCGFGGQMLAPNVSFFNIGDSGGFVFNVSNLGIGYLQGANWTSLDNPSTPFVNCGQGNLYTFANTKNGEQRSGFRANVTSNGVVTVNGQGINIFPGAAAAANTGSGGQFLP